jgi:hypothetical protein
LEVYVGTHLLLVLMAIVMWWKEGGRGLWMKRTANTLESVLHAIGHFGCSSVIWFWFGRSVDGTKWKVRVVVILKDYALS